MTAHQQTLSLIIDEIFDYLNVSPAKRIECLKHLLQGATKGKIYSRIPSAPTPHPSDDSDSDTSKNEKKSLKDKNFASVKAEEEAENGGVDAEEILATRPEGVEGKIKIDEVKKFLTDLKNF
tara:strand:- start:1810 stop:2175 length:366 start_codon:yes stop_codon:yes gene_type:complete